LGEANGGRLLTFIVMERKGKMRLIMAYPMPAKSPGDLPREGIMATETRIPAFKSEKEEAAWWDAHPDVVTELFLKAKKEGKIMRLPGFRGATKPVTIRMPVADVEAAQEIAGRRGLAYQTYIKALLHQALERERNTE
jgi:predicted DNA binding CopG/RHH family protein